MRASFVLILPLLGLAQPWPRYGGPSGDFSVPGKGIQPFTASGPKQLWRRPLGDGYSGIVTDGRLLYTMYRRGNEEVVAALDAATGKTQWEYSYPAPFQPHMMMEPGPGPHSTPLLMGGRVFTIGILARMHAFDKETGKLLWTKDLIKDFPGAEVPARGYASSPIAYKDTIIVQLSGHNHSLLALRPHDSSLVWAKHTFDSSPCTPLLVTVEGQEQLITRFADEAVGVQPGNGDLLWRHPHRTDYGLNIATPVWGPDGILVLTSGYNGGAKGLKLSRAGGKASVEELWSNNRLRVHFQNAVRAGSAVCGSSGDFGPAPVTCLDAATGKVLWQDRAFAKASFLKTAGGYLLLDEDGTLALVDLSPAGMKVKSRMQLFEGRSWTAPTLAGNRLYARDRREILALEFN